MIDKNIDGRLAMAIETESIAPTIAEL